ncbi:hypothetical protein [Halosimplex pelagicum]|uniref:Uncharacterized protein n=1 Tax=Halosimplex pelagicum TaxID=869886 RepID=A0A7D5TFY2_9EURY|nr:hypothetical protein [Halosimplex pelagicum]QLH80976.1 hypothetical protein HZS54_04700 [Halosimplex pelagicum]
MPTEEGTIDIETSGDAVALRLVGNNIVDVHIRGDAAADYAVDVRKNGSDWIEGVRSGYSGSANYDDVLETGADEIRLRCTNGTGTADNSATITLMAS